MEEVDTKELHELLDEEGSPPATIETAMEQQAAWEQEYNSGHAIPTSTRTRPSSAVVNFDEFLRQESSRDMSVLDLGAGAGRNCIFLAKRGYQVTALDFSQSALKALKTKITNKSWSNNVRIIQCDLTKPLPFADDTFDAFIDITTTTSLLPEDMKRLVTDLKRVVKQGGLFTCYTHSQDDGYLKMTAPEQNHYEVDSTGIIDYAYTETELRKLYSKWQILDLQHIEKEDVLNGEQYVRRLWRMVGRNKK